LLLLHGTTRKRAEAIIPAGPDANFREPSGGTADGFSTAPVTGPFDVGDPKDYARKKAAQFPNEGGPAVITIEIPDALVDGLGLSHHWRTDRTISQSRDRKGAGTTAAPPLPYGRGSDCRPAPNCPVGLRRCQRF